MSDEVRHLSIYRHEAYFDAIMATAQGMAEYILQHCSALRAKTSKRFASWKRARAIAATMKALSCLEDHVLRDIGIDRDNIYAVSVAVVDDPQFDVRDLAGR